MFFWRTTTFSPWCINLRLYKNESQLAMQRCHFCWHGISKPKNSQSCKTLHLWSHLVHTQCTDPVSFRLMRLPALVPRACSYYVTAECTTGACIQLLFCRASFLAHNGESWLLMRKHDPHRLKVKLWVFLTLSFWTPGGTLQMSSSLDEDEKHARPLCFYSVLATLYIKDP